MKSTLTSTVRVSLLGSCIVAALLSSSAYGASPTDTARPVQAVWKPVEIRYSYVGFTTAYNCDAFEAKMKNILQRLGSPPQTKVQANGCIDLNRPSRNFFVTVTTATPVPASEAQEPANKTEQELIDRLNSSRGDQNRLSKDPFPATWKTVDLSRDRKLDLQPGDCELMEGLRKDVLPKLGVKVVSEKINCTPKQLSIQTPDLVVSALMPAPKADDATAGSTR
jgi:hypothetical protein